MKRIILCEGKTDAILISYFLEKCFGWSFSLSCTRKPPVKLPVTNPRNEELNWYQHTDRIGRKQELAIWGVGGDSQIPVKLRAVSERNQHSPNPTDRFEYIVLFLDHDESIQACLDMVKEWIADSAITLVGELQPGQWVDATVDLRGVTPPGQHQLHLLPIVLPPDKSGALETFLIDCWKQLSEEDEQLAEAARVFIDELPELSKETYLNRRRLPDKACLGTILSVFSPDGLFLQIDPKLKSIPWEQVKDAVAVYEKLGTL